MPTDPTEAGAEVITVPIDLDAPEARAL